MKFVVTILLVVYASSLLACDPTRPKIYTPNAKKQVTKKASKQPLTGILKKGKQFVAILDGEVYRSGDTFRGSRITKITRTYVQLSGAQGSRRLTLIASLRNQ